MSYAVGVMEAVAADLAAAGLGVWRPDGPGYLPTERAIWTSQLLDSPAEGFAVSVYDQTALDTYATSGPEEAVLYLQIRYRMLSWDEGVSLYEPIRALVHRRRLVLPDDAGVVVGSERSWGPLGPDANERPMFAYNAAWRGLRARA